MRVLRWVLLATVGFAVGSGTGMGAVAFGQGAGPVGVGAAGAGTAGRPGGGGVATGRVAEAVLPAGVRVPGLVDVTARTGIRFKHRSSPEAKYIVESMSGGVALFDFDGDGWTDIYFTNAPSVEMAKAGETAAGALYRNNHDGTFTDVTVKAGVGNPCWAMGAAVGDYDNDGRPDLLVSCFGGVVLYRNNGDGTFTDVTKKSGLAADHGWATGVTFGDYDGDGFSDIFVPHYVDLDLEHLPAFGQGKTCQYRGLAVQCGPRGLPGAGDSLWHNNGDGTFTEVGKAAGVDDPKKLFGLGAVWEDFDGDGRLDLFVANDGGSNYLYRNLGGGRFAEAGLESGVAYSEDGTEQANMGVALGDFGHTGRQSVVVSHFAEEYAALYVNEGKLSFNDDSKRAEVAAASAPYVGWGDAFADLDNAGWLDLLVSNGHVYPQMEGVPGTTYRQPLLVYLNRRDGTFAEVGTRTGTAARVPRVSRGLAVADLFHTGREDVVIEDLVGAPVVLEAVPDPANHWLSLWLEGAGKNRLALNARVRVTAGGMVQTAEVRSGGSYLSQSELPLHFGLGRAAKAERVEVMWPGGEVQVLVDVAGDRRYGLLQGAGLRVLP